MCCQTCLSQGNDVFITACAVLRSAARAGAVAPPLAAVQQLIGPPFCDNPAICFLQPAAAATRADAVAALLAAAQQLALPLSWTSFPYAGCLGVGAVATSADTVTALLAAAQQPLCPPFWNSYLRLYHPLLLQPAAVAACTGAVAALLAAQQLALLLLRMSIPHAQCPVCVRSGGARRHDRGAAGGGAAAGASPVRSSDFLKAASCDLLQWRRMPAQWQHCWRQHSSWLATRQAALRAPCLQASLPPLPAPARWAAAAGSSKLLQAHAPSEMPAVLSRRCLSIYTETHFADSGVRMGSWLSSLKLR